MTKIMYSLLLSISFILMGCSANNETVKTSATSSTESLQSLYDLANKYFAEKKYSKTIPIYKKLAAMGQANASNNLGNMYRKGMGVKRDYSAAAIWYKKAVAINNHIDSQANLGWLYNNGGFGIQKNEKIALDWSLKAANRNNAVAQNNVGNHFDSAKNFKSARKWWLKSANQNYVLAQSNLGNMFEYGREGVSVNYKKAAYWYEKAANQNDAPSQNNLANLYFDGNGVPKNREKAIELYTKAAKQGEAHAKSNLKKIIANRY